MKADRQSFYADVAKGLAASAKLYHVDAVVHVEDADDIAGQCGFDFNAERERYAALGLHETNAYLYVRGHDLYNSLVSIGRKLCEGTGIDFEQNIMKSVLAFDQYDEITKIKTDIVKLQTPSNK